MTNKLKEELNLLEMQLIQETEERLKIEKQLWDLIAVRNTVTVYLTLSG
jgi:hypothetical protein